MVTNLTFVVSLLLGTLNLKCGDSDLGRSVYDNLFNEVVRLDRAADAAWVACATKEAVAARQADVRMKTLAAIGGFPEKTPLNAQVTGTVKKDGYVVEKILFESLPKHYVTAHLFLPDDPAYKPPYPGVVSPCGHSGTGKLAPWYQRVGVTGAKLGLATLVVDPIDQGERRQHPKCPISVGGHNCIGYRANLLGWNVARFRVWDGIRACDYLASRPDVDPQRLGVTGLSGGGTLSSYLNALDGRYRAGSPAGFISTVRDVYDNLGPQDAEQVIFGQAGIGFNHLGIVALRAPSPTMVVTTHGDYFPFMGSLDTFENLRKIYGVFGAGDRVELMETSGPHHWYESTRHAAMLWIRRWAGGDLSAWPTDRAGLRRRDIGFSYDAGNSGLAFDPPETRNVTPTGSTLDLPGARSVYDLMREELGRLDADRAKRSLGIRAVVGMRPLATLGAEAVAVRETPVPDGRAFQLVLSRNDDLVPIPFYAFLPEKPKRIPLILFTDAGAKSLEAEVKEALAGGRPVAVAELRGFGATAKARHSFYGSKRPDEEMALLSMTIGENLVARRAEDAALAARHFSKLTGAGRVDVMAFGAAAIPAAHAYALERQLFGSFAMKREPPSWRTLIEDPTLPFAFADTVFGALQVYDWVDLVR
ncbi:MAG: prolyl oligopeptidase family serine peptidase [Kiritimatiellae bacterium]|nr:prolyl oligopeptidase family serine peptidase [Kiritimatiellia bacterium]